MAVEKCKCWIYKSSSPVVFSVLRFVKYIYSNATHYGDNAGLLKVSFSYLQQSQISLSDGDKGSVAEDVPLSPTIGRVENQTDISTRVSELQHYL